MAEAQSPPQKQQRAPHAVWSITKMQRVACSQSRGAACGDVLSAADTKSSESCIVGAAKEGFFFNQPERAACGELGTVTEATASISCGLNSGESIKNCLKSNEDETHSIVIRPEGGGYRGVMPSKNQHQAGR